MSSEFLRVFQNLSIGQVHMKKLDDKIVYHLVLTILLDELPVALDSLVFMRFSIKPLHDLDAKSVHSLT